MLNTPYQIYQQNSVQTATPGQLVVMLYDGAVRYTKAGLEGIQSSQFEIANTNLKKAQAIIHELIAALNFDYDIAKDLARLYEYFLHQLLQANMKKNAEAAEEVLSHLQELREAWKQSVKTNAQTHPQSDLA